MRRIISVLIVFTVLAAACGDDGTFGSTSTSAGETTTSTAGTTSSPTTEAAAPTSTTTTAPTTTTTVPGSSAVDHTGYCVRGTASNDALNVRSGPGTDFAVVAELAWNAAGVPAGGYAAPDPQGRPWFLVGYDGGQGWAASWYLEPAPCGPAAITVAPLAGPGWPDALAGSLVPWTWVDEDWALALYRADWSGPLALYLVGPYGDTYEVFTWPDATDAPLDLLDWRPDGTTALVGSSGMDPYIRLLDLPARTATPVPSADEQGAAASFTRPTGRELVVRTGDAATERIEVRRTDGSLFSVLFEQPRPAEWSYRGATWIYGLEGTTAVIGDGTGLSLVDNQGDFIRDLDAPGAACEPVRWWDPSTVLARCIPPEVLAYEPNSHYRRLWLVPANGSPATALTALPTDPVIIVDFGFFDAWRAGGEVFANWTGDCGAASVDLVQPDGATEGLTYNEVVGTMGPNLLVRRWSDCDQSPGSLHLVGLDGAARRDVLVPPAGAPGVVDALMMRDLP